MRRIFVCIAAMAVLMPMAGRAYAEPVSMWGGGPVGGPGGPLSGDPLFDFAFIGPGLAGSGVLTASSNGDGSFTATAGSFSVFGDPLLAPGAGGPLFPNPSAPAAVLSPSGFFIYDNQLFPTSNPTLDVFGLLFTTPGHEINIWANGPGSWEYNDFNTVTGADYDNTNFQFFLAAVPEPGSLTLMGLGAVGLAALVVRRRINRSEPSQA
jgi:hypothetical protein